MLSEDVPQKSSTRGTSPRFLTDDEEEDYFAAMKVIVDKKMTELRKARKCLPGTDWELYICKKLI
jgi:hypothetical protein